MAGRELYGIFTSGYEQRNMKNDPSFRLIGFCALFEFRISLKLRLPVK